LAREFEDRGEAGIADIAEGNLRSAIAERFAAVGAPMVTDLAVALDARVDVAQVPHESRLGRRRRVA